MEWKKNTQIAFTLPEILVAVAIFSVVSTVVAGLYIQSFRETRRANLQNQVYEDARFVLEFIANEVRNGTIDYDEYYNQNVVIPSLAGGVSIPGAGAQNFGQNYGRYYSSFFYPGEDGALGFDCNTVTAGDGAIGSDARTAKRNKRDCTPLRLTLDRNTGLNPFSGKAGASVGEDAFCGAISYSTTVAGSRFGMCDLSGAPNVTQERKQPELYLISADGTKKTILARELVAANTYVLSLLRMDGQDSNNDGVPDTFVCAEGFQCMNESDCSAATLPRSRTAELATVSDACDTSAKGFSRDFVPISPLRVNIKDINFFIYPTEDPHYAFAEGSALSQPRVTVVLTVEPNAAVTGIQEQFKPLTLVQTISSRVTQPVPAPLLVR